MLTREQIDEEFRELKASDFKEERFGLDSKEKEASEFVEKFYFNKGL